MGAAPGGGGRAGGLTFFNKKFRYEVKVLKGRQLPR